MGSSRLASRGYAGDNAPMMNTEVKWLQIACFGLLLGVVGCEPEEELFVDRPLCEQLCARQAECGLDGGGLLEEETLEESARPLSRAVEPRDETGEEAEGETAEDAGEIEEELPPNPCVEACVDSIEFIDKGPQWMTQECVEAIRDVWECLIAVPECPGFEESFTLAHATEFSESPSIPFPECTDVIDTEVQKCGCDSHAKWCAEE